MSRNGQTNSTGMRGLDVTESAFRKYQLVHWMTLSRSISPASASQLGLESTA